LVLRVAHTDGTKRFPIGGPGGLSHTTVPPINM